MGLVGIYSVPTPISSSVSTSLHWFTQFPSYPPTTLPLWWTPFFISQFIGTVVYSTVTGRFSCILLQHLSAPLHLLVDYFPPPLDSLFCPMFTCSHVLYFYCLWHLLSPYYVSFISPIAERAFCAEGPYVLSIPQLPAALERILTGTYLWWHSCLNCQSPELK